MKQKSKLTPEQLTARGRKAAQARWAKYQARLREINTWNKPANEPRMTKFECCGAYGMPNENHVCDPPIDWGYE